MLAWVFYELGDRSTRLSHQQCDRRSWKLDQSLLWPIDICAVREESDRQYGAVFRAVSLKVCWPFPSTGLDEQKGVYIRPAVECHRAGD